MASLTSHLSPDKKGGLSMLLRQTFSGGQKSPILGKFGKQFLLTHMGGRREVILRCFLICGILSLWIHNCLSLIVFA